MCLTRHTSERIIKKVRLTVKMTRQKSCRFVGCSLRIRLTMLLCVLHFFVHVHVQLFNDGQFFFGWFHLILPLPPPPPPTHTHRTQRLLWVPWCDSRNRASQCQAQIASLLRRAGQGASGYRKTEGEDRVGAARREVRYKKKVTSLSLVILKVCQIHN